MDRRSFLQSGATLSTAFAAPAIFRASDKGPAKQAIIGTGEEPRPHRRPRRSSAHPDPHARVTLLDKDNQVITHLGFDQARTDRVLNKGGQGGLVMRTKPETWEHGWFIHPHDACLDRDDNIFVVEWVRGGRVTKLRKV
jgi:hypothetical protein